MRTLLSSNSHLGRAVRVLGVPVIVATVLLLRDLRPQPAFAVCVNNDALACATTVTAPLLYTIGESTAGFTTEGGEALPPVGPCAKAPTGASAWFDFTPVSTAPYHIDTFGSSYDTVVAVWTGAAHPLAAVAPPSCNDDAGPPGPSILAVMLTAGTTYHIQVTGIGGATGGLVLTVACLVSNNYLACPTPVTPVPYSNTQSTAGADTEAGEALPPCQGTSGATVWYDFVAPATASYSIDTFGSSYDTVLAVWTGTAHPLAPVAGACNDDALGTSQSQVTLSASMGTLYHIQVGGFASATGTLHLNVGACPDSLVCAKPVGALPYTDSTVSTVGATVEPGEALPPCQATTGATVWYDFVAPSTAAFQVDTFGSSFDTVLAVWTGTAHPLTPVPTACNDDAGVTQSQVVFSATMGTTYHIQIGGFAAATGSVVLHVHTPNFVVNSTADTSNGTCLSNQTSDLDCTLREAINASNAFPNAANIISFNIGGVAPYTITPGLGGLPAAGGTVLIDATTQSGYAGTPLIELNGTSAGGGANGLTLGGPATAKGFAINRFGGAGISIPGPGNTVMANYIGTDPSGTVPLGNGIGIDVSGPSNSISGNSIGANITTGVQILGATGNSVHGNGVGYFNGAAHPNLGVGVLIGAGASGNTVVANTVADNVLQGVRVESGTGNQISQNAIHDNGALGIDLFPLGVTPNDLGDPDVGANNLQNFPIVTSAAAGAASITIQGTLNTNSATNLNIELFQNAACDGSGNGEGEQYLGVVNVTTDAGGSVTWSTTIATSVAVGQLITATATRTVAPLDTSEFSACLAVTLADPCPEDLDQNMAENGGLGKVGFGDLLLFAGDYNATPLSPNWHGGRSNFHPEALPKIGFDDLLLFAGHYNQTAVACGASPP